MRRRCGCGVAIAQARPWFGYVRLWIMRRREGWPDNKKRIHRLDRLEGLQGRMRARRKTRLSLHRGRVPPASGQHQAWMSSTISSSPGGPVGS
jgi:putative transposase